ncbi:5-hydroxyisourate hydrolase [Bactrocera neohumeralis]|uniref:5-hydroxyisourate hydrolase n=1 Tax=Bactrocera tryoni TaxID=59916 RepID=UPI001A9A1BFF|nr:5-hydroxyisourate hydrolase [Bactrocera tryoni]XP_039960769.1 5-hydroxyisourate hydrolase [Bactrocera tryoni]XP_039960771.1 5-hydroxyisourate hydrolase [Bactrocera tryoni]XP_050328094.1 5-hydroxyisourate hydrolase [Bactrocera neohumeralis]XP_050328095.1 5-hydroxyisourate hydrolase [Bactrocera neohumeralis]XP_050328096.1 5-hydroxyisourate hydrolase [Bactrocera neohumeralis]XP_050328097.1 5-hydroxyisourate hydrolase [Bactrocera neohumeralis]XP_050328099.1 5-hydroxyisourate hydrolase [Bactro
MKISAALILSLSIISIRYHSTMSSSWERIRLRVETKEGFEPVSNNSVSADVRTISAHILDTTVGQAAANVNITVYRLEGENNWQKLSEATTNQDGRVNQLVPATRYKSGIYKLHFDVKPYHTERGISSFYPFIEIVVLCEHGQHYHIPLLLNPFGYTTYRGT